MSSHDPPITLAKVDANEEVNKELATEFEVKGFPTIKILRNGGKHAQEYKGPRDADGIVAYLKKQSGPASAEIKSVEDATSLIDDKKIFIVCARCYVLFLFVCFSPFPYPPTLSCSLQTHIYISIQVGVFPKFSGEEFENFTALAEKLRSEYEFGHTSDAKLLPRGESSVTGPIVRLFKPFDELIVDSQVS